MKEKKQEIFEITIKGEKWYYYTNTWRYYYGNVYHPTTYTTYFFKKYRTVTKSSWFGLVKKEVTEPYVLFTINIDVRNPKYTKQEIMDLINKELKILDRKEEIKRNGII